MFEATVAASGRREGEAAVISLNVRGCCQAWAELLVMSPIVCRDGKEGAWMDEPKDALELV